MNWRSRILPWALGLSWAVCIAATPAFAAEDLDLRLRFQEETSEGSGRFHRLERAESWDAAKTAVIVCDMWDSHHCFRAVQRAKEFAPRLNEVVVEARRRGATIIHAPSDCMDAYVDHPARQRATGVQDASDYPDKIDQWCHQIPAEEAARYPIDQSDGGEDDTPAEHARWHEHLRESGRDPERPWKQQISAIEIDSNHDYITDKGKEVWNILRQNDIQHVILAGVHTNMCVLGRPFGLRRMVSAGMDTVLMRDMTDTMYNPAAWPYVSHFTGTDLIIDHVERFVCPTVTSDQIIGGEPFRFSADQRPHVAIVIGEPEYETERTLPLYAEEHLRADHRISMVFASEKDPNRFPGIELIGEADAMLLSVRRRTPPREQLEIVRSFVSAGKPVLGIRTANHAFALREGAPPAGAGQWPEMDAAVFGGNYSNHYGSQLPATIRIEPASASHPVLEGISEDPFIAGDSLYMVSPLAAGTTVLLRGRVEGKPSEPVAWTYTRADGGKSFYTSLGAPADFEHPAFQRLVKNAVDWAVR